MRARRSPPAPWTVPRIFPTQPPAPSCLYPPTPHPCPPSACPAAHAAAAPARHRPRLAAPKFNTGGATALGENTYAGVGKVAAFRARYVPRRVSGGGTVGTTAPRGCAEVVAHAPAWLLQRRSYQVEEAPGARLPRRGDHNASWRDLRLCCCGAQPPPRARWAPAARGFSVPPPPPERAPSRALAGRRSWPRPDHSPAPLPPAILGPGPGGRGFSARRLASCAPLPWRQRRPQGPHLPHEGDGVDDQVGLGDGVEIQPSHPVEPGAEGGVEHLSG